MAADTGITPAEKRGIDRRTLIRRGAAAGAIAWAAPTIIGSLSSPAAAITGPCGCNRITSNASNCNFDCNNTPCSASLPSCVPNTACQELKPCLVAPASGDCTGQGSTVTFTVNPGCTSCTFTAGKANLGGQAACVNGVPAGQSITFPAAPAGDKYNQFAMQLQCGNCPPAS